MDFTDSDILELQRAAGDRQDDEGCIVSVRSLRRLMAEWARLTEKKKERDEFHALPGGL